MGASDPKDGEDVGRDLATWLQEAGRRHAPAQASAAAPARPAAPALKLASPYAGLVRRTAMYATLAAAYMQYFFLDVMLQIAAMHGVIVFVAVAQH